MISTLLTVLKNLPELIRLTFLVFASPFYNIFLSLRYGCLIHPLARISPRVRFGKGCVVGKSKLITYYGGQITVGNYTTIHWEITQQSMKPVNFLHIGAHMYKSVMIVCWLSGL